MVKRIQKLHKKIRDIRRDFQHKTSTNICKNHAMVVIEDLNVKAMSKSAQGTIECPGTKVKAKSVLNKAILDQGWYEFRRQLEYKSAWRGGVLIAVSPRNTSKTCAACGIVDAENRTSQENFLCVGCGHREHADLNASYNILAAGRAVIGLWRDSDGNSVKQEPIRVGSFDCLAGIPFL